MALLAVENLTFTYPNCAAPAIENVSLTVERGEFLALCGPTGCGKSTLLRLLKRELAPLGELTGTILVDGSPQGALTDREAAARIGYVMQRPEHQIVTDKVWHELAFGLENLGLPQAEIARRVAEMAAYFGVEGWFEKEVSTLSGGQKQLLNLTAVMVMQPEILILDEPTAQLDPIAASDFIATVRKINRELGLTVIITEHRLEEVIPLCDRLLVLDKGRVADCDVPRAAVARMADRKELLPFVPAASRLYHAVRARGDCPLDVREGRAFIEGRCKAPCALAVPELPPPAAPALAFRDVYFRYDRKAPDVLSGMSFTVGEGEICCILGGNGSGKSTALSIASGLRRPYAGEVRVFGKRLREYRNQALYRNCLTLLPQDVQTVFLCNTVREELRDCGEMPELPIDLAPLMDKHPYDLSGGEQQLLALCKTLATKPRLLLLDEPTKGVDASAKERLIALFKDLRAQGMTLLIVTHDVELAAECADRCAFMFRGQIVSEGSPRAFFSRSSFYTTAVSRMTRGLVDGAVTVDDAAAVLRGEGSA